MPETKKIEPRKKSSGIFPFFLFLLYLSAAALFLYIFFSYFDFYFLTFQERPRHLNYANLKPGGFISHGLGILGSLMMILLLFYSIRKRTNLFGKAGAVGRWLDIHIFFGSMGPLFIILHSTFKLNGIISISFWSMIIVALSGFLGRYIYVQIPRTIRGEELSLEEIKKENLQIRNKLNSEYNIDDMELDKIEKLLVVDSEGKLEGLIKLKLSFLPK